MESTSVNNDDRISDGLRTHTQGNTGVYLRLAADFRNLQIETRIITAGEMFNWQHEPLPEHVEWRQRMCRGRWLMLLSVLSVLCMDAKPPWRAFTNRHLTCNQWSITQPRVWIFCLHIDVITAKVDMKETLGRISDSQKSTRLCITVLGGSNVGKTALIVRYLTGRFIGEYYSGGDVIYRHSFAYFGSLSASYDIVDASDYRDAADSGDLLRWTERNGAFIVVYSVTDAGSLVKAAEILDCLPRLAPKFLLASKLDLQHRRQVNPEDGQRIADEYGCSFGEFSASESKLSAIKCVFHKLIRQLLTNSFMRPYPRIRIAALSRLIGSIISKTAGRRQRAVTKTSSTSSASSTSSTVSSTSSSILAPSSFRLLKI